MGLCAEAQQAFAEARVKADAGRREWVQFSEMADQAACSCSRENCVRPRCCSGASSSSPTGRFVLPSQQAYCRLGEIYLEWNMLEDAERTFLLGEQSCEETRAVIWRTEICLGLAWVAWARGEFELAFDEVERAIDYGGQAGLLFEGAIRPGASGAILVGDRAARAGPALGGKLRSRSIAAAEP